MENQEKNIVPINILPCDIIPNNCIKPMKDEETGDFVNIDTEVGLKSLYERFEDYIWENNHDYF